MLVVSVYSEFEVPSIESGFVYGSRPASDVGLEHPASEQMSRYHPSCLVPHRTPHNSCNNSLTSWTTRFVTIQSIASHAPQSTSKKYLENRLLHTITTNLVALFVDLQRDSQLTINHLTLR